MILVKQQQYFILDMSKHFLDNNCVIHSNVTMSFYIYIYKQGYFWNLQ